MLIHVICVLWVSRRTLGLLQKIQIGLVLTSLVNSEKVKKCVFVMETCNFSLISALLVGSTEYYTLSQSFPFDETLEMMDLCQLSVTQGVSRDIVDACI